MRAYISSVFHRRVGTAADETEEKLVLEYCENIVRMLHEIVL